MDRKLEKYILEHTDPEDEILSELNRETYAKIIHPRMISGHLQGKFLTSISKMIQPRVIIEVGTFTGYSTICLARGLHEHGILHTIEINDELFSFAEKYFQKAGFSHKIKQHTGDARYIIKEIQAPVDLVFIDGDKDQYVAYYKEVLPIVKPGGYILADNVLWNGKVVEDISDNDKFTKGIIDFNSYVRSDLRVEKLILPLRDGLMLIRKKE
jgi:predicted O-methyltransferase YrrM